MARKKLEQFKSPRIILFWILGSISAVVGALIAGNTRMELGTSQEDFIISLAIAGFMFLLTGIFWVSSTSELKDIEELVYEKPSEKSSDK